MKQAAGRQSVVIVLAGLAVIAIILAASGLLRASDFAQGSFDRALKVSGHVSWRSQPAPAVSPYARVMPGW